MEEDDPDPFVINVPKAAPPSASDHAQAQATSLPTYDNTGQQLHELPAGTAVQDPDMGDPLLSFGTNADDNFTTFDDTARFRAAAPSPASGVGVPQNCAVPSFTIPAPPPWAPWPEFGHDAGTLLPSDARAGAQDPPQARTFALPPASGASVGRARIDPANPPPRIHPPDVSDIPRWQPTPVTTGGLLSAAAAGCTTTDQANPRQLFGTGSGGAAQHPSQQSLLREEPRHESRSTDGRPTGGFRPPVGRDEELSSASLQGATPAAPPGRRATTSDVLHPSNPPQHSERVPVGSQASNVPPPPTLSI